MYFLSNIKQIGSDSEEVRNLKITTKKPTGHVKRVVTTSHDLCIKGAEDLHCIQKLKFEAEPYKRSLDVTTIKILSLEDSLK